MGTQEQERPVASETSRRPVPFRAEEVRVAGFPRLNPRAGRRAHAYADETGLERLVFFSDAVFAIAITLLALEIRLPQIEGEVSNEVLLAALGALWPRYLGFGISFLAIGLYWLAHHRTFRAVLRYDTRLMALNLLLLAGVAFMPFPTSVISEHTNRIGTQFYALSAGLAGLILAVMWLYTHARGRMITGPMSRGEFRRGLVRVLVPPVVFGLSVALAAYNEDLAKYSWLLIAVAPLIQ